MRILHIWDQAGVAGVLAKYQRRRGHEVKVIKRLVRSGYNYGLNAYYGIENIPLRVRYFYPYIVKLAWKWDIVHFHTPLFLALPMIKAPVIQQFHGSDLRMDRAEGSLQFRFLRRFSSIKRILVSTPDLLNVIPSATWLPTPIDTELFTPRPPPEPPLDLPVPHERMPEYLAQLDCYEQKRSKPWALSKMSLEALACGVCVDFNGLRITPPLPDQHKAENVVSILEEIYLEALEND